MEIRLTLSNSGGVLDEQLVEIDEAEVERNEDGDVATITDAGEKQLQGAISEMIGSMQWSIGDSFAVTEVEP